MALAERIADRPLGAGPDVPPRRGERHGPQRSPAALAALRRVAERSRPVTLADDRSLPVVPALAPLLPGGRLQRGVTVGVEGPGATTLALALGSAATAAGSWGAVVGQPSLGLLAAEEVGVALERLLVVAPPPTDRWATVVAALVDAVDVVWVAPPSRVRAADARRLATRARERGAVLVRLPGSAWPDPAAVRLTVTAARWTGADGGAGHLRGRQVDVIAEGRGAAARRRRATLWLPGPDGGVAVAAGDGTATAAPAGSGEPVEPRVAAG